MYKVFFNDRLLIIADNYEKEFLNNDDAKVSIKDPGLVPIYVRQFLAGQKGLLILSGDKERLWHAFQQLFLSVPAAGGVVKSNEGYLFIFRRGKWDLPKGKTEDGETPAAAALREVSEETGLQDIKLIKPLPSTWHIYPLKGEQTDLNFALKETCWFLMEVRSGQLLTPETAEEIELLSWFKPPQLTEVLNNTFSSLRELIESLR
jgi:8-oxo-dGTP pyrophosphatase MutT (NUDIX family)